MIEIGPNLLAAIEAVVLGIVMVIPIMGFLWLMLK